MTITRTISPILPLVAAGLIGFAGVTAALASGQVAPETRTKIETVLTEQGYTMQKLEREDSGYEAKAMKDGAEYELYLDTDGKIVKIERDD